MADSVLLRLIDFVLLLPFFFVFSIAIPLIDSQMCVPSNWAPLHPKLLIDLKTQYGEKFGDYLFIEKPFFFVGLIWVEIFLLWPLSVVCTYGILTKKQWFQKTCLVAGVSCVTGMAAIMAELLGSGRGSSKLYQIYVPFAVFGLVATIRGFIPCTVANKKTNGGRKKRA